MSTDGNTAAIERMMADREEYDKRREAEQELQDLRDEVDALAADLTAARAAMATALECLERIQDYALSDAMLGFIEGLADDAIRALATPQEKAHE